MSDVAGPGWRVTRSRPAGGRARSAAALAWIGAIAAAASGLLELLAGIGHRLGWWHFGVGIQIVRWSALAALAALAIALIALLLSIGTGARASRWAGVLALVLGVASAGAPLYLYEQAKRLPPIHDISTDTVNPPRFTALLPLRGSSANPTEYSAVVAAEQKRAYPDIAPALFDVPPQQELQTAERVARAMGWQIVAVESDPLRIEATATTLLFGFKDDVVVRITPQANGSRVDVRSLSRVGVSDLGTNAARIRTFLARLKAASTPG
jgi:uncharacterized protein (DUF1499 family)